MRLRDFQIHSIDKLDGILAECCRLVLHRHKENPEYWGAVGACLLGSNNVPVYGVNHVLEDGHRDHAEVDAIKNYLAEFGKEGLEGSILITTLSPCSSDIDQPDGRNCVDYINSHGIKKVYCGYTDPLESITDTYKHKKFHIMETRNPKLRELCAKLRSTFSDI